MKTLTRKEIKQIKTLLNVWETEGTSDMDIIEEMIDTVPILHKLVDNYEAKNSYSKYMDWENLRIEESERLADEKDWVVIPTPSNPDGGCGFEWQEEAYVRSISTRLLTHMDMYYNPKEY